MQRGESCLACESKGFSNQNCSEEEKTEKERREAYLQQDYISLVHYHLDALQQTHSFTRGSVHDSEYNQTLKRT